MVQWEVCSHKGHDTNYYREVQESFKETVRNRYQRTHGVKDFKSNILVAVDLLTSNVLLMKLIQTN